MKIVFFINGGELSHGAERARRFASAWQEQKGDVTVRMLFRSIPKWKAIIAFFKEARAFRPDVIYVMDTAYSGVLAAAASRAALGCSVVIDTGDAAYELARSSGNYTWLELWLIWGVERLAFKLSEAIFVRGSFHRKILLDAGFRRVFFIPDGVSREHRDRAAGREAMRRNVGLEGKFVVGMVGTMVWSERYEMCYGWDVVEALMEIADECVHALLVGDGDGRRRLEDRARQGGVYDRIHFVGQVHPNVLLDYIGAMDVCISTQSNDVVGWVRTTGKLPLYLACGRYVIATDVGEAHNVLPGVGTLLEYKGVRDPEYPTRLAEEIVRLKQTPELLDTAQAGPRIVDNQFDYEVLAERVMDVFDSIVQETLKR